MNKTIHKIYVALFFIVGIGALVLLIYNGYDYYRTPLTERFYTAGHKLYKPSGKIGHGLGIIGSLMMITGVAVYMLRKRSKKFMGIGALKYWLEFHIFLCTVGPMLVLFHTAFKFGGIVSVSFWSMVAVVLSGVIGRFIYLQIPRTIQGQELSLDELSQMDIEINNTLRNNFKVDEKLIAELNGYAHSIKSGASFFDSFVIIFKSYFMNRKYIGRIKRFLIKHNVDHSTVRTVAKVVKSKLVLSRKIKILEQMQALFKYWHVAHLPFAIVMFVIMIIHIGVVITFGYKWIF